MSIRRMLTLISLAAAALAATAASAQHLKTVYKFTGTPDGANPYAGLTAFNGALIGTTAEDGTTGHGTIFSYDPVTRTETLLYSFAGGPDGSGPTSAVVAGKQGLVGVTQRGGTDNLGVVYRLETTTGAEAVLHQFRGGQDGAFPFGKLVVQHGAYYGVTLQGGGAGCDNQGCGTVFRFDPHAQTVRVVARFNGVIDGTGPVGLFSAGSILYGTTTAGGKFGYGTVFKLDPVAGTKSVVHDFTGQPDGAQPLAPPILRGGILYGTTASGGASNAGSLYRIDPTSGAETVAYSFQGGSDGASPEAALFPFGSYLYGTTDGGGASGGNGTVFAFDLKTGAETVLHSFAGPDGAAPHSALILRAGLLYGTTIGGGKTLPSGCETGGCGTVFQLTAPQLTP